MRYVNVVSIVFACLVLVSVSLNLIFFGLAGKLYRDIQMLRLDPSDSRRFAAENSNLRETQRRERRIVLLGDSRISQWQPLPSVRNCQWVNRGVSGETTAQTILRLDNDVISLRPSIVVVEVGINDLKTIGLFPNLEQQITNSCFANLNTLVIRMTEHGIHVVVLTIIPPGRPGLLRNLVWSEAIYTAVERVNATIKNLQGRRITVVDCAQVMCIGKRVKPQYARDTLHLNSAGYEMLNTSLSPVLKALILREEDKLGAEITNDAIQ